MEQDFPLVTLHSQKAEGADLHPAISATPVAPHIRSFSSSQIPQSGSPIPPMLAPSRESTPLPPFQHDPYAHESGSPMQTSAPRYPESSQRTLQHHPIPQLSPYSYHFPSAYDDLNGSIQHSVPSNSSSSERYSTQRYPAVNDNDSIDTFPSDLHIAPLSMNLDHASNIEHALPSMNTRLPSLPPSMAEYRQSMSGYHQRESQNQRQQHGQGLQQQASHDDRAHEHSQGRSFYPHSHAMSDIASRRESPSDSLPYPHSRQHLQPAPRNRSPTEYSTSYPGRSSSSGNHSHSHAATSDAKALTTNADGLYTEDDLSSIPMSNSPPHHIYTAAHEQHPHSQHDNHAIHPSHGPLRYPRTHQHHHNQATTHSQNTSAHHAPPRSSYHQHQQDAKPITGAPQSVSVPRLRLERPQSNPRTRSTPESATTSNLLRVSTGIQLVSLPAHSLSPLGTSDNDSTFGSESNAHEDDENGMEWSGRGGGEGRGRSRERGGKEDGTTGGGDDEDGQGAGGIGTGEGSKAPAKQKKKSKMHECPVCGKKFPRPSGLKTHMNTHSNEKPYACGFPGCSRTFGVRSNAKRHLRTHGVIPTTEVPESPPYVVDFSTPMILPAHPHNIALPGAGLAGPGRPQSELHAVDRRGDLDGLDDQAGASNGHDGGERGKYSTSRIPPFKLRWMPLSLTSRTNAAALREVQDAQFSQHPDIDIHDRSAWGIRSAWDEDDDGRARRETKISGNGMQFDGIEEGDLEHGDAYRDAALAARLSVPSQPIPSSSRAGGHAPYPDIRGAVPSGRMINSMSESRSSSSNTFASRSPASSAASFTSPPQSASLSPPRHSSADFLEERSSYIDAGSHPYHPSQRHNPN